MTADRPTTEPRLRIRAETARLQFLNAQPDAIYNGLLYAYKLGRAEAAQGAAPSDDYTKGWNDALDGIVAAEGAAPRAKGHAFQHDWRGFDQCRAEGCGKSESAHAAPRAEGLDEAVALLREWSKWAHEEASTNDQDALDFIVDSDILTDKTDALLARLSRPSDERTNG